MCSYRHQLNHTPKQIYNCDFPDCQRTFVRQDLCNRHRDRHTAKGSQLHRKDSMLGHAHTSPVVEAGKPLSAHGSSSPEVMRPSLAGIKSRASQLQYQSPQDINNPNSYSPITNPSSGTYSGNGSSNGTENFSQSTGFKRSNSDNINRGQDGNHVGTPIARPQRHASFGMADSKPPDFSRQPLQTTVGPYGLLSSASGNGYHGGQSSPQQPYVSQQNFTPFTLPPPGFSTSVTAAASTREADPTYPTSMSTDYPNETSHHQQSGPDMMLLDQMTAPNTMPVFGGEGYSRSPFAIPEDFVAYLFSGQQVNEASPMGPISQQGYAKSVFIPNASTPPLIIYVATWTPKTNIIRHTLPTMSTSEASSLQASNSNTTPWRSLACLIRVSQRQYCPRRRARQLWISSRNASMKQTMHLLPDKRRLFLRVIVAMTVTCSVAR